MNWYDFTKDIIIPLLGVVSTIIIGIVIAVFLRNKEERSKIKSLLIDRYMAFLKTNMNFISHQIEAIHFQILKDIYLNFEDYFTRHSNSHTTLQRLKWNIDKIDEKLGNNNQDEGNWTFFTYEFAFLLGAKKYSKELQPLENKITQNYFAEGSINMLKIEIKKLIKNNEKIVNGFDSTNSIKIDEAVEDLHEIVARNFSSFYYKVFNPYSSRVADLIDKY